MPNTSAFYDDFLRDRDDHKKYGPYARHIRRITNNILHQLRFETVLDVGCGQGAFLQELCLEYPSLKPFGVDLSPVGINRLRQRLPTGQFQVLDISRERLPRKFDLVTCMDTLEHIPDDDSAIRHLASMTGHYLLVNTVQGRMRSLEPRAFGHVRNYARGEVVNKLQRVGLRILQIVEWGFPFYSPLYRDFNNTIGQSGTEGTYGPGRKMLAQVLYLLFCLNSSRHGDVVFILAENPTPY